MRERVGVAEEEVLNEARDGAFDADDVVDTVDALLTVLAADETDLARRVPIGGTSSSEAVGGDVVFDTRRLTLVPALGTLLTVLVS